MKPQPKFLKPQSFFLLKKMHYFPLLGEASLTSAQHFDLRIFVQGNGVVTHDPMQLHEQA